jgi:light-regulated signal transduction histidine kinase (bacteriophytochrome)
MFTIWEPVYRLESLIKLMTGLISITTTGYMLVLMPKVRKIPTLEQLEKVNLQLAEEVAQHRATMKELARSQVIQTQHMNDLEAVNNELEGFIYSVAHDLRAPIRHMNSYAILLGNSLENQLDEEQQSSLFAIKHSANRMGRMMDELLAFSRGRNQALKPTPVDLNRVVEQSTSQLTMDHPDRHIDWEIDPLPTVEADYTMLEQVFDNLLSNAVKFTRDRDPAKISIRVSSTPEGHTFTISDNGAGFNMKYKSKLFGLFQRLHKQSDYPGHGVGLANVKRILARHGGEIEGDGQVEGGATFRFTLPNQVPH